MGSIDIVTNNSTRQLFNARAVALETSLRENLESLRALVVDVGKIQHELETCEEALNTHKELCQRKKCSSSETLEKILESKINIINLAVATAIRIDETKNLSLINQLLKILCGDIDVEMLTPPKEDNKENIATPNKNKSNKETITNSPFKKKKSISPKKNFDTSIEDVSIKDESVSEIEGTPGRTSPIIQTKKLKSSSSISSLSGTSTDSRDKKKCPDNWGTPEPKQMKLCFPSPQRVGRGKLYRQGRLSFAAIKPCSVVDLTCSPELSTGTGTGCDQSSTDQDINIAAPNPIVQILIKKESSDNDDTILPSPTSSAPADIVLSKTTLKDSQKFKKPLSLLRVKTEHVDEENSPILHFVDKKTKITTNEADPLDDSINILKPNRFAKSPHKLKRSGKSPSKWKPSPKKEPLTCPSTVKQEKPTDNDQTALDEDMTHCEASMSILNHVNKLEHQNSPAKRPLAELQNNADVPSNHELAKPLPTDNGDDGKNVTEDRNKRRLLEPVYKEPTVRKKVEKLALPGWCCDDCKSFFGKLYANDPVKLAEVIARCSKHRGRNNPARPPTPPGFWYPRWDVPSDTEEFNRRNNAQ